MAENQTTEATGTAGAGEAPPPQAPITEPEAAPPPEADAGAEDGGDEAGDDGEGEGSEGAGQADGAPEQKHKRAGGYQRKIERLEREKQFLYEQLQRTAPQPKGDPDKKKTPSEEAVEYIDRLVEQRLAAKDAQRHADARTAEFNRRASEVRASHPDFDEVVQSVDAPVSEALGHVLLTSERGPEIMYQLAKNPAELARLSALPPLDAAREVGKLEAKAASGSVPNGHPKAAPRKPPAPAPVSPVTARGPTTVKRPEEMSYEEYSAWRNSQRKR